MKSMKELGEPVTPPGVGEWGWIDGDVCRQYGLPKSPLHHYEPFVPSSAHVCAGVNLNT